MESKILYFEGAGMDYEVGQHSDVGNYRIRTAFTNDEGIEYYIELGRATKRNKKGVVINDWGLRIDHLFKIEDRHKEELSLGGYEIKTDHKEIAKLNYTTKSITNWINTNLNCSFGTIEVLSQFHGYRVHDGSRGYNLIDNHVVDHELAEKRRMAFNKADQEYMELTKRKYSAINIESMDDEGITIRCYASKEALNGHPRYKRISTVNGSAQYDY